MPAELLNGITETLNSAVSDDFMAEYPDLCETIRHNNEVFSAFKVHDECSRMAKLLLDGDGKLKGFEQWARDVEPIASHHNKVWLRTEYDQALRRAQQARDWKQYEEESDVLPNLRWVPSTAAHPGADHMPFWNTVRPINDPFWSEHKPGDRWGCQCSLEATDDPATDIPEGTDRDNPAPGLDGNPAVTGHLFSETHPYYPSSCGSCPFYKGNPSDSPSNKAKDCGRCPFVDLIISESKDDVSLPKRIEQNRREYLRLKDNPDYAREGYPVEFNPETGGLKAIHVKHNLDSPGADSEIQAMNVGYERGDKVILEMEDHSQYKKRHTEGSWNDQPHEVSERGTGTSNNVRDGLKHCASKPGCKVAVLVFKDGCFSNENFCDGLRKYSGLKGTSQWADFDRIICIQNEEVVKEIIKKTNP